MINVDNIHEYKEFNRQFINHFSFFNFDWNLAMGCVSSFNKRVEYTNSIIGSNKKIFKETLNECTAHAFSWNKALQNRKNFVTLFDFPPIKLKMGFVNGEEWFASN